MPLYFRVSISRLNWSKSDSDPDNIREHPHFKVMLAAAGARFRQDR